MLWAEDVLYHPFILIRTIRYITKLDGLDIEWIEEPTYLYLIFRSIYNIEAIVAHG